MLLHYFAGVRSHIPFGMNCFGNNEVGSPGWKLRNEYSSFDAVS